MPLCICRGWIEFKICMNWSVDLIIYLFGIYDTIILVRIFVIWYMGVRIWNNWSNRVTLFVFFFIIIYLSRFVVSSYFCLFNGSNFCAIGFDNFVNVFFKMVSRVSGEFLKDIFNFFVVVSFIQYNVNIGLVSCTDGNIRIVKQLVCSFF